MDWTEERIDALRRMWLEGMSASQVARQLGGVSRNAVIGKVHRIGLAGRDAPSRPRSVGGRPPTRLRSKMAPAIRSSSKRTYRPADAAPVAYDVEPSATILTLADHACRWPIGDPETKEFGFCGRARSGHGSYCAGHSQLAFRGRPKASVDAGERLRQLTAEAVTHRLVAS